MTRRRGFDFDISVSASKQRSSRKRSMSGEVGSSSRVCEWEGCNKPGAYRAPKSRDNLSEYRWFCLDHIREYNQQWNYYENMSDEEVAASTDADRLWGRPTWEFGKQAPQPGPAGPHADGEAWKRFGLDDPLEVLGDKGTINPGARKEARKARERLLPQAIRRALEVMHLDALATKSDIRTRYKELVKRFHPDQNGGDRSEEARLREVLWAWEQLSKSDAFSD